MSSNRPLAKVIKLRVPVRTLERAAAEAQLLSRAVGFDVDPTSLLILGLDAGLDVVTKPRNGNQ